LFLLIDEQIEESFFIKHGDIFASIMKHYKSYHTVPGKEEIASVFPSFEFVESDQPLKYFIDALKQRRKKNILSASIEAAIPLVKSKSVEEAEIVLRTALTTIKREIKTSSDIDVRDNTDARKEVYLSLKEVVGIDGMTSGWEALDDLTMGYHKGDLVVFIAEPKRGKTWLLIWQAYHAWKNENCPILILTREMRPQAIEKRFDAIACKLPYNSFRRGLLSSAEEKRYEEYLNSLKTNVNPFVILGYSMEEKAASVSSLIPKIEKYLIDGGALFVDGLYLMEDDFGETDWRGLTNIARDLKNLAQTYKIPIIATTQAKIEGKGTAPGMENIAYAKYIAQYVDALMSIQQDEKMKLASMARIFLVAQREGDVGYFPINFQFDPFVDFSQKATATIYNESEPDVTP
jgi:replicative DNA helicase